MHGYSHAVTGLAGWAAVTSTSGAALSLYTPEPEVVLLGSLLCAGAAMCPDADHEHATISHSLPPISKPVAMGIGAISGGHRHGTHSFVGIAAYTVVAWAASLWVTQLHGRDVAIGSAVMALLMTAFAMKSLGVYRAFGSQGVGSILRTFIGPWLLALALVGTMTWTMDYTWSWLPLCMAIGCYIHVFGDSLTVQGVPWLWPLNPKPPKFLLKMPLVGRLVKIVWQPNGYFRFPILGKTGSETGVREKVFAGLATLYWLYLLSYEVFRASGHASMLF